MELPSQQSVLQLIVGCCCPAVVREGVGTAHFGTVRARVYCCCGENTVNLRARSFRFFIDHRVTLFFPPIGLFSARADISNTPYAYRTRRDNDFIVTSPRCCVGKSRDDVYASRRVRRVVIHKDRAHLTPPCPRRVRVVRRVRDPNHNTTAVLTTAGRRRSRRNRNNDVTRRAANNCFHVHEMHGARGYPIFSAR